MKDFYDDADAARQLVPLLDETFDAVVATLPHSVKIAVGLASDLGIPILESWTDSNIEIPSEVRKVLVVDDGVETGRKALSIAEELGERVLKCLAVPICSREIESVLLGYYTRIYAVKRPFVRRSLDWHYEIRPNYTPTEARAILDAALD